jgi:hypothetical protein
VVAWFSALARGYRDPEPHRSPGGSRLRRRANAFAAIVLAWLVIPLAGIMLSPVRQDGVRYVMPCVLAFAVIAAAGLDGLAMLVEKRRGLGRTFHALAGLVVLYLGFTVARTAPYYIDYFGEHTGGAGGVAETRTFETAWWGESIGDRVRQRARRADDRPHTERVHRPEYMAVSRGPRATITPSATRRDGSSARAVPRRAGYRPMLAGVRGHP